MSGKPDQTVQTVVRESHVVRQTHVVAETHCGISAVLIMRRIDSQNATLLPSTPKIVICAAFRRIISLHYIFATRSAFIVFRYMPSNAVFKPVQRFSPLAGYTGRKLRSHALHGNLAFRDGVSFQRFRAFSGLAPSPRITLSDSTPIFICIRGLPIASLIYSARPPRFPLRITLSDALTFFHYPYLHPRCVPPT